MKWALLILLLVTTAVAQPNDVPPPLDPKVLLKVTVVGDRREFHMGEIIPIELAFSSRIKDRYRVNEAQYDRSGRMNYEHFVITPPEGAVDPLAEYFDAGMDMLGGLTGFSFLSRKAWTIRLNVNEWLRFTKAGEYKLKVASQRVEVADLQAAGGTSPVTTMSNEVTFKVLPPQPVWEKRVYEKAVAALSLIANASEQTNESKTARSKALETLRFLGTPQATHELVQQLREDWGGGTDCFFGIISSPHRDVAREALEQALADPDHAIGETFLDALSFVESENATREATAAQDDQKAVEKLVRALPNKRGKALHTSLYAALNHVWVRADRQLLPKETTEQLVCQLITTFDDLATEQQAWLLDVRWEQIKSPALLPLLKRYAERDFSNVGPGESGHAQGLTALALRRWFELDPAGARPVFIGEISQPNPRLGAAVFGLLPDATLPEVDKPLREQLVTAKDFDSLSNTASLIARYATSAIFADVVKELDAHIGRTACTVQASLLAYVLRVDPKLARSRVEKAIAARGKEFTACNHGLLSDISVIHYDPVLEEIAIRTLDDRDPQVAADAATALRRFGSAAAEAPLWSAYERWSRRWQGREKQLAKTELDLGEGIYDLTLGRALCEAIATAQGWLTDQDELHRLARINDLPIVRKQCTDQYLAAWEREPLEISLHPLGRAFYATVAQYSVASMAELKAKLAQFPAGTHFVISRWSGEDTATEPYTDEVRAYINDLGMVGGERAAIP